MVGYQKALDILRKASTENGFVAAVQEEDNYRRIWTRDSALCGLAALSTDDKNLKQTFKKSIETIFLHQHPQGFIPSNVSPLSQTISYGSVVGRVDNHAWIIISACTYALLQNENQWLQSYKPAIEKCFQLMTAWEFNGRGLMYVPQSADWADEYHHHGYILYNQLLRLWALRAAANAFEDIRYQQEAAELKSVIEIYFSGDEFYAVQIKRMWGDQNFPYWIMGFNTSTIYSQFDLQANILALLLKIGEKDQQQKVLNYVMELMIKNDRMLPSFYPVIGNDDFQMNELNNNFAFRFRNHPFEFHNGGLWPVWNGLAAFVSSEYNADISNQISHRIEMACQQNNWEFNECYHGQTNASIGVPYCSWSAAGLILSKNTDFISKLTSHHAN